MSETVTNLLDGERQHLREWTGQEPQEWRFGPTFAASIGPFGNEMHPFVPGRTKYGSTREEALSLLHDEVGAYFYSDGKETSMTGDNTQDQTLNGGNQENTLSLTLNELEVGSAKELHERIAGRPTTTNATYALFQRVVCGPEPDAWLRLLTLHTPLFLIWLLQLPEARPLLEAPTMGTSLLIEQIEAEVQRALTAERLTQLIRDHKLFGYLKMIVWSCVSTQARKQQGHQRRQRSGAPSLAETTPLPEVSVLSEEIWRHVLETLDNEDEHSLIQLSYVQGLSLEEISMLPRTRFPDQEEAACRRRSILQHWSQDARLRTLLSRLEEEP